MNERYFYRGKRLLGTSVLIGSLVVQENRNFILPVDDPKSLEYPYSYEVDPNTVGQCTGLRDKNGKLIYEGDIVLAFSNINGVNEPHLSAALPKYQHKYVEFVRGLFRVSSREFPNGECGPLDHCSTTRVKDITVVGNISENPELIEGRV